MTKQINSLNDDNTNIVKVPKTYEEQVEIMNNHGIEIYDPVFCKRILSEVNYYRIMAYALPFKEKDGTYHDISFTRIYRLYEFDRKLRKVLLSSLEEIEIFLRTNFAYYHAHKYGSLGYEDASIYNKHHDHNSFINHFNQEISIHSKFAFVKHHQEHYNGKFPIWVAVELFTFGMLSKFYFDMTTEDQKKLALKLYNENYKNLKSWLRCCTDIRNICAHYGRLYYRIFTAIPAKICSDENQQRSLWACILTIKKLYPNSDKWKSEIVPAITNLLEEYHGDICLNHIGFPENWLYQL